MASPAPRGTSGVAAEEAGSAIRRYEERLTRDPDSLAFAPLADAYRKAGRAQEAIALCRAGLARFPHYTTARLILAKAQIDEGLLEDARAELDTIIAASPRDAEAHRLAGELSIKTGRASDARRHLELAVDLQPDDREARYLLDVIAGDGRVGEGSPLARALVDDWFATRTFAAVCLEQGLVEEAAQICFRILRTDPGDARARAMLAQALRGSRAPRRRAG
jgi:tetratricopeptide (TPR) repeat protein